MLIKIPKILFRISLLLLFAGILSTCKDPQKAAPSPAPPPVENTKAEPQDPDPYFAKVVATTSPYGPTHITRNILQDSNGDMWFSTWEGIIRYDGTSFLNFTNKEHLREYHVFSLLEDRTGELWFGTIGAGVYRYDGESFTNITQQDGLVHNRVGCFYQDKSGNLWIGTQGGISLYNGKSFRNFTTGDGLSDNDINSILEDGSGKMWIASRGELCIYDGITFTPFRKDRSQPVSSISDKEAVGFFNVRSVIEDRKGNIWFGGKDGLWRYGAGELTQVAKEFVGYIYEDQDGDIWTSSVAPGKPDEWRLSRYPAESQEGDEITGEVILEEKNMFFGITGDTDGNIWLGSLKGVARHDGEEFNRFRP